MVARTTRRGGTTSATAKPVTAPRSATATSKRPVRKRKTAARAGKPVGPVAPAAMPKAALKLVRDSFTMPQRDFGLIAELKQRLITLKRPTKKSELLRAGLQVLSRQSDEMLLAAVGALITLKPGRPKKHG